ncbi:MAG: hypothetical protein FWF52_00555 [Candidatus Azobacteroides sp.]|nr:hypothetical protein [Candidatus Azobacteroides sp.]
MKIGILILAHSNPDQLKLLVDLLKNDFSLFIHLDKRSSISSSIFEKEKNIFVIKRHAVYWGSYNQILATIDLYRMAQEENCDYYLFISGSDLPIRTNQEIIAEIEKNPQINYIDYGALPLSFWPSNGGFDRMQLYWENLNNPQAISLFNFFCGFCRQIQKLLHLKRKLFHDITYYGGANWANLSQATVAYVLQFIHNRPEFIRSFRYTRNADEIWLQTIILHSPYRNQTVSDTKRYIDWLKGPEHPRILRIDDYDNMMQSSAFFARKFDATVDTQVIEKIRLHLLNQKNKSSCKFN